MPRPPAYRAYITTGRLTHTDDSITSTHMREEDHILRVLKSPSYNEDDYLYELSFGTSHEEGGLIRFGKHTCAQLLSALLLEKHHSEYPISITGYGIVMERNREFPRRLISKNKNSDCFSQLQLTIDLVELSNVNRTGCILTIGDTPIGGGSLELTPEQRQNLADFINDTDVTPYVGRPETTTLVEADGNSTTVPTGKLHSSFFKPHRHLQKQTTH